MTEKVVIKCIPTGIPGLDAVLGGGIPEFSFNLIAGPPGCGKTTLANQMMFSMATVERPALYLMVLGEPPLKMLRYQQQFDFFNADLIDSAVRFVNLTDDTMGSDLEGVLRRITAEVEKHKPAFVFVDSFRSLLLAAHSEAESRNRLQRFVQQLGILMTSWQATTFLIGEYSSDSEANPVFTIADGLIWLRQSVQRNSMVRKIEVVKMRGQATIAGLHSFRIGMGGVEVFAIVASPSAERVEQNRHEQPRLKIGVGAIDEMMGGGIPRGYSLLVAGPSGAGKSIMAAAFLAEGARCGETGVLAAFEQNPNRSLNRVVADLIANKTVGLVDTNALDVSIDEVLVRIVREIQRLKATRVVIDSLSGFELAIAPTFREDFRESLSQLVFALVATGVTVFMTSELEDRFTDLRFSPYGTAFLTDAIIVQRYVEVESRLRRVLAVVKVRGSAHSDELREYHIDDFGIQIGAIIGDQEGLLAGSPTQARTSEGVPLAAVAQ